MLRYGFLGSDRGCNGKHFDLLGTGMECLVRKYVAQIGKSLFYKATSRSSFQHLETVPLSSLVLLAYLQDRGINTALAKKECMEVRFSLSGKWNFAIGFPNASGGYEVRNKYFKGCIAPKTSPMADWRT